MSKRQFNPRILALLAVAAVVAIACVLGLQRQGQRTEQVQETTASPDPYASIDFDDPVASYEMLRYVVERGGDKYQRQLAIDWLDEQARLQLAPSAEQEAWLLCVIESGGHPDWDIETQLWLFNNAFNYLHLGQEHEALSASPAARCRTSAQDNASLCIATHRDTTHHREPHWSSRRQCPCRPSPTRS